MANEILGTNQRRANTRPEEIATEFSERSSDLLDTALLGAGATALAKKVAPESVVSSVGNFLQKNPNLQSVAKNLTSVGGKAAKITNVPLFAYTVADSAVREATGRGISERTGEEIGGAVGNLLFPGAEERSAFTAAPTLQALADQKAQGAMTEDDKVDNLQSALQSVPDTPQVVPGTLPTAQESGQRLIDAAKEFYPGAFAPEAPAVPTIPAAPAAPGLSPDALQAIQSPTIPESVTSAEVPAGLGPMQFIDRETGEPLDPAVVKAVQDAGMERFLAQGAFPEPQAPTKIPPMGEAETKAILQSRFSAPTALQQQDTRAYDNASAERDQRIKANDRQPGESQAARDSRVADSRKIQSENMKNRKYTDSQLRRLFPNNAEYQAARVKDIEGIDPLTNQDYADQDLDRQDTQSRIDARDRGAEDPAQIIKDARAKAQAMAEESGLSPDDPDYDEYILNTISEITNIPRYIKPIPKYPNDAAADAAYAAGDLREGDDVNVNGKIGKYTPPPTTEEEKPRLARGQGGRSRQEIRNQEDQ